MALWGGLSTKAAPQRDAPMPAAATRRLWASPALIRTSGVPYRTGWDVERAIKEGVLRSIWTYKAVDTISKSLAELPIIFPKGDYLDDSSANVGRLDRRLNFKANPFEYAFSFRYRLVSQLLMSPKGAFVEYERDADGEITWMYLLNPDRVAPIPHQDTFVAGYEIDTGGQPDYLRPDQVAWIKLPHPTDPYASLTPLEAAGLSIDLDFYARLYNRNFMANDGRPGGILAVRGPMPEGDVEILRRRMSTPNPGVVSVVESEGMSFADLSTTPRDAAYKELSNTVKNEILVAFGVGESVIGNASGRTYDNADAEENVYWRITLAPLIRFLDMPFSSLTPGGDDDDVWVRHDTSRVQALQKPIRDNEARVVEQFREGTRTLNDVLTVFKMPTIDVPGANAYFIAAGKIGVAKDPADQEALETLKAIGGGAEGEPAPMGQGPQRALGPVGGGAIGASLAMRRPAFGPVRSPERVDQQRAIEANATAQRRDMERKEDGAPAVANKHYCIMLQVPEVDAQHLWAASPVPPTQKPHVTVGLYDIDDPAKAELIAREWAEQTEPVKLMIGPDTWVWENGTGPEDRPFVVGVRSDSLHEANARLTEIAKRYGGAETGMGKGDYKPHFTIAYLDPDVPGDVALTEPRYVSLSATDAELSMRDGSKLLLRLKD